MPDPIQRLNYHTGLFLEEAEFKLEQNYHMLMRQRINYALFQPGVVYGMNLEYSGGVLKVKPGMAVDEYIDPDNGPIGREIVVLEDVTVSLSGYSAGDSVWVTAEWAFSLDAPKAPTNLPARITNRSTFAPSTSNPGTGATKILLGKIVIGTDATVTPTQKAVLRLGGASAPLPTVTNLNPASGGVGTSVVITGTNFTGATGVSFGGAAATTFAVNSPTQITATVPVGAVTGKVRVTTPAGFGESATNFTVSSTAPTVSSFTPTSGPVGTSVVITGTNFTGATGVSVGGIAAITFTVDSATQITATVPVGAVTGKVRVTTPAGFGESAVNFTVTVLPVIKSILPTSQAVGGTVDVRGENIRNSGLAPGTPATGTVIRFVDPGNSANVVTAGVPLILTDVTASVGPQRVQVTVPAKGTLPNIVNIVLEFGGGTATSPQQFTFV